MLCRLEVGPATARDDSRGRRLARRINDSLGLSLAECRIVAVYTISGLSDDQAEFLLGSAVWHDPVLQRAAFAPLPCLKPDPAWFCEVAFRPGVTDNEANAARDAAALALNIPKDSFSVAFSSQYRLVQSPEFPIDRQTAEKICREILCNELIQRFRVKNYDEWLRDGGFESIAVSAASAPRDEVGVYDLANLDDDALLALNRANTWALNLEELRRVAAHFAEPKVAAQRAALGLPPAPTDAEMEALAQTWSEHCKHKIFSARIDCLDEDTGRRETVDNLYKTCVREPTAILRARAGADDICRSVFKDNAGVIAFINGYDACIKVETHNSPSALDPYGGALTGIVGVNRDPLGTGMGADLVCNMDVFCFASPFLTGALPPRVLHPRRIMEGVRQGVEDGGNQSGIPTVNGSMVFDPRYLGKPLVFCGTVGLLPAEVCGRPGHEKKALPGDVIVMVGGRIGKDGIRGATFSSEELNENSPATAVQIGDPITQRKMADFILVARDHCLYHAITDNGAGGLSSSVGEMAEDTGGCLLNLDKAPLKYDGLRPWEILLSEAQERMTLAVSPDKLDALLALARRMDVEATAIGRFTDSGFFDVRYRDRAVAYVDMKFLHDGAPRLRLEAVWRRPRIKEAGSYPAEINDPAWNGEFLLTMLGRLNICSRESLIRRYDHEVRGGSAVKPLAGVLRDGPTDGAVLRPLAESDAGLILAHGICPKYGDYDAYWMAANAVDEAIRNAVAVGANPDALAGVDNFCWPDPIYAPNNPDGRYKLAQLVRACRALRQFCLAYGVPCVSGKDSMKNDYVNESERVSIPPTLLFTVLGVMENVTRAQTSDFKKAGDYIYLLGGTWRETGASEAWDQLGLTGGKIPFVNPASALPRYKALNALMGQRAIAACHDCSDGGLAVALAEMCVGGRLGCVVDLDAVPVYESVNDFETLYSESASRHLVEIAPELAPLLDALGEWQICRKIGEVAEEPVMRVKRGAREVLSVPADAMARAFKKTLSEFF